MYIHAPCRGLLIQADAREGVPGVILRGLRAELTRVEGGSIDGGRRAVGLADDDLRRRRRRVLREIHVAAQRLQRYGILLRPKGGIVPLSLRHIPVFLTVEGDGAEGTDETVAVVVGQRVGSLHRLQGHILERHPLEVGRRALHLAHVDDERRAGRDSAADARLEVYVAVVADLVQQIHDHRSEILLELGRPDVKWQAEHVPAV